MTLRTAAKKNAEVSLQELLLESCYWKRNAMLANAVRNADNLAVPAEMQRNQTFFSADKPNDLTPRSSDLASLHKMWARGSFQLGSAFWADATSANNDETAP
jgi:hypothetical protein